MIRKTRLIPVQFVLTAAMLLPLFGACSQAYYGAMEKVGIHKRDILVDRVKDARDSQAEAQEQFKSAPSNAPHLEPFGVFPFLPGDEGLIFVDQTRLFGPGDQLLGGEAAVQGKQPRARQ